MTDRELIEQLMDRVESLEAVLYEEKRWAESSPSSDTAYSDCEPYSPDEWLRVLFDVHGKKSMSMREIMFELRKVIDIGGGKNKYLAPSVGSVQELLWDISRVGSKGGFVHMGSSDDGHPLFSKCEGIF